MSKFKERFLSQLKAVNLFEYIGLPVLSLVLIALDILSKYFIYQNLANPLTGGSNGIVIENAIPGLIDFTFVTNNGAAWNILSDQKWILCLISLVAGIVLMYFMIFKFLKLPRFVRVSFSLMIAGCFGNLIDRIGYWGQLGMYKGGVIDFLWFHFWHNFPVFNLADSYLVVGIAIIVVGYLIVWIKGSVAKEKNLAAPEEQKDTADLKKKLSEGKTSDASAEKPQEKNHE